MKLFWGLRTYQYRPVFTYTKRVLLEVVRAGTPESKVRVWSRSLDPIDSVGQPLSIRIGHISTLQGIGNLLRVRQE